MGCFLLWRPVVDFLFDLKVVTAKIGLCRDHISAAEIKKMRLWQCEKQWSSFVKFTVVTDYVLYSAWGQWLWLWLWLLMFVTCDWFVSFTLSLCASALLYTGLLFVSQTFFFFCFVSIFFHSYYSKPLMTVTKGDTLALFENVFSIIFVFIPTNDFFFL